MWRILEKVEKWTTQSVRDDRI